MVKDVNPSAQGLAQRILMFSISVALVIEITVTIIVSLSSNLRILYYTCPTFSRILTSLQIIDEVLL